MARVPLQNDTLYILDLAGSVVSNVEIDAATIPADFPRGEADAPPCRPDSLTTFKRGGKAHGAASLKNAGAITVFRAATLFEPRSRANRRDSSVV